MAHKEGNPSEQNVTMLTSISSCQKGSMPPPSDCFGGPVFGQANFVPRILSLPTAYLPLRAGAHVVPMRRRGWAQGRFGQ